MLQERGGGLWFCRINLVFSGQYFPCRCSQTRLDVPPSRCSHRGDGFLPVYATFRVHFWGGTSFPFMFSKPLAKEIFLNRLARDERLADQNVWSASLSSRAVDEALLIEACPRELLMKRYRVKLCTMLESLCVS